MGTKKLKTDKSVKVSYFVIIMNALIAPLLAILLYIFLLTERASDDKDLSQNSLTNNQHQQPITMKSNFVNCKRHT